MKEYKKETLREKLASLGFTLIINPNNITIKKEHYDNLTKTFIEDTPTAQELLDAKTAIEAEDYKEVAK